MSNKNHGGGIHRPHPKPTTKKEDIMATIHVESISELTAELRKNPSEITATLPPGSYGDILDGDHEETVIHLYSGHLLLKGTGHIETYGDASATLACGGTGKAHGNSRLIALGDETTPYRATYLDRSTGYTIGSGLVEASGSSVVQAYDDAAVSADGGSQVVAKGGCTVALKGCATVAVFDNSTVIYHNEEDTKNTAVAIDETSEIRALYDDEEA